MRKTIFPLMLLVLMPCFSETNYSLDLTTDLITGIGAVGINIPDFFLDSGPQVGKDISEINPLDRSLIFSYDKTQDDISTYASAGLLLTPVLTPFLMNDGLDTWVTYGAMYSEAFLLTNGTKNLLKSVIPRNRPYSYKGDIPEGEESDYYNSFPSGHTSYAFLGATFLATTLMKDQPDNNMNVPLIASGYTLATIVAAMRISSGNHFVSDVLTGALIGSFYGWLIPTIHDKENFPSLFISSEGSKAVTFSFMLPL